MRISRHSLDHNGEGFALARKWFRLDAEAQFALGVEYKHGKGVPQNHREAVKWYRRAAEREHAGAQYQLGRMYHQGRASLKQEISKDYNQALNRYLKAAKQNHARAHCSVGRMYAIHAYAWLALAAEASPGSHSPTLLGLESSMTQGELSDAHRLAAAYRWCIERGIPIW